MPKKTKSSGVKRSPSKPKKTVAKTSIFPKGKRAVMGRRNGRKKV